MRLSSLLVGISLLAAACSGEGTGSATTGVTTPSSAAPVPDACDEPTPLFPVAPFLDGSGDSCRAWVNRAYGRAVNGSTASATVWSRRNEYGTALIVGAIHTLGLGWFGAPDTAVPEEMVDPADWIGVPRLFLIRPDGSGPDDQASPWFGLYNPAIASERNNNLLRDLLPREDFYVAVADSQKLDVSGPAPTPEPLVRAEVPLYDPDGVTTADPTWAEAVPGEAVLLLGFPDSSGELTAGVGRVLADAEAEQVIVWLAGLGDVEGGISYDPEVEVVIRGSALPGMSGGAVVDLDGRLVGILVRATEEHDGVQYVRAVRMSWIDRRLVAVYAEIGPTDQAAVRGFLEPMD